MLARNLELENREIKAKLADLCATNRRIDERCADLEEEVDALRANFGVAVVAPGEFDMTPAEAALMGMLITRPEVTEEAWFTACYTHQDRPPAGVFKLLIYRIRQHVEPLGIKVQTVWGTGYRLSTEHRKLARRLVAEMRS